MRRNLRAHPRQRRRRQRGDDNKGETRFFLTIFQQRSVRTGEPRNRRSRFSYFLFFFLFFFSNIAQLRSRRRIRALVDAHACLRHFFSNTYIYTHRQAYYLDSEFGFSLNRSFLFFVRSAKGFFSKKRRGK